jgi:Asp-tRNA(Asn)/Glu-tRNA(Gln) amidotransferase A subunit family amidase
VAECVAGFSLQEVLTLLAGVMALVGLPVGIQFRAAQAQNAELLDLLKDQLSIQREQAETLRTTERVIRGNSRGQPRA